MEKNKLYVIDVERVKLFMKAKNIDDKTMASGINMPLATVKKLLRGDDQGKFRADAIHKIAKFLNIKPCCIFHPESS